MALLKIKDAMTRLGFKSPQSIYNLKDRGELRIVHLPPAGGKKRKGAPRIPSDDVDRLERRALSGETSKAADIPMPKRQSSRPKEPLQARKVVPHFE